MIQIPTSTDAQGNVMSPRAAILPEPCPEIISPSASGSAICVSQEFDLGEVEIDFISFVPRGANRKKYFLVKEDRALKDDILKSILETDEGDVSRVLKEAGLEGEAAGVLEAAAKLLKAYKDELPDGTLRILAKASGLPEHQPAAKRQTKEEGAGEGKKKEGAPGMVLSKEALEKMDPATQAIVKQLQEENTATKAEAREARQIAKELKEGGDGARGEGGQEEGERRED